ncbi:MULTISPECIES: restriction endonuclease subunit S [unclassified Campylobacter]|uniref:restriction endonuclease subunit S n=1 Tax=unclassified Campylobacter TaxID=2593542 RepID=UPI001D352FBD|nr:restriction endonuclease subunit S [Campylobacter sp. RM9331]MBZ8006242.1 restriction endonuclease subunit S [Campylobacter sp. RM9332]
MSIPKGWQEVRLGDIISIKSEKYTPNKNEVKKCIELEHLEQNTGILLEYTNSNLQKSTKNVFKKGQVLFGKLRPYLKKYYLAEFDGVCSSEIWVMSGNNVLNNFLFYLVQSDDFMNAANISCGTKMPRADWKYMQEITIKLPPLKEQEKIAKILSSCDEHIKNLKNLKSELEKEKLHLMNELLSGKTRFANFTTPWQEVTLNDLGATYNGLSGKKAKDFEDGNSNYITYKNIFDNRVVKTSIFEKVKINDDEKQNLVKKGDVFFTTSSETPHEVGTSSVILEECENLYLNSFCFGFRPNESINSEYASFYFRSSIFREKLTKLAQGSTRYNLSKTEFLKIKIQLPSLEEQKKIGEVLSVCDKRLECLNELITAQITLKSHLLTELLSGNIRVMND